MILKRIESRDLLKYRRLEINDIPRQGQIAVSGPNESGKTAIGETICFGLFGRTFSLGVEETTKVVRWGQYAGSVKVTFVGTDGNEYVVEREVETTGRHDARLYAVGHDDPIAEGVQAVLEGVRQIAGFTYKSFVDSFYLAQREMEVPHGKSDTVKALIGVDRLELVQADLRSEIAKNSAVINEIEQRITAFNTSIAQIGLDRAKLGRLESQREAVAKSAADAEARSVEYAKRAATIGKAATGFIQATKKFVASTTRTSHSEWKDREQNVSLSLVAASTASKSSGFEEQQVALDATVKTLLTFHVGLDEYKKVCGVAGLYRDRTVDLLADGLSEEVGQSSQQAARETDLKRFPYRRAAIVGRIQQSASRRKRLLLASVLALELALLTWSAWIVLVAAPTSTVGGWVQGAIVLGESARRLTLLLSAIGATALAIPLIILVRRQIGALRDCEAELEEIDEDVRIARAEISVIDAIDDVAVPDALDALRAIRNDLLGGAVTAFANGDGAILVKPDALTEKLSTVRASSVVAARSLSKGQARILNRAKALKKRAEQERESIVRINEQVCEEKKLWGKVESFERQAAELAAKGNELRHVIVVRDTACGLIDATCRQIYSRFHPELRRFVSKILPKLTEDRYEHLDIDDDLRVRVFCKEKNDFVGLKEISNGTHRQLMLCVRLALSQALIASSGKTEQFIFFDEPFAFFDEKRMVQAIEVLRKISPQITQVFLATQKFDDTSQFDMVLDCNTGADCFEVSAKKGSRLRFKEPLSKAKARAC